jgi:multicomponent Na+:H+ antiporter subunit G
MIGELLAVLGSVLMLLAGIGVIRFGDPLARMHALAKASTLGILLILAGAAMNLSDANDVTSVVLAGVLHIFTSPPTSNMVSRAVYLASGMPHEVETIDEGAEPLGLPYHDATDRAAES